MLPQVPCDFGNALMDDTLISDTGVTYAIMQSTTVQFGTDNKIQVLEHFASMYKNNKMYSREWSVRL